MADDTPERQRELHDRCEATDWREQGLAVPVGKPDPYKAAQNILGADAIFLPRDVRRARER